MELIWGLSGAVLGALWRRWEGAHVDGFLGHRWLKLAVAVALGTVLTYHWGRSAGTAVLLALVVAADIAAGWTYPAQFGSVDGPFPWALAPRYGLVTAAAAILCVLWLRDVRPLMYAPVGLLAPLGYYLPRHRLTCWTCAGEAWLGATFYGALPLLFVGGPNG